MNLLNDSEVAMLDTPLPALKLGIPPIAHKTALAFAAPHCSARKRQQIYCNTLAVWMVNKHLTGFGIRTDLNGSRTWQPQARTLQDVADLHIPGYGHLACRPVLAEEDRCYLPATDQAGCVVVQFDAEFSTATLLGFSPVEPDRLVELPLSELQDLTVLYQQLPAAVSLKQRAEDALTHLTDWFQGEIAATWAAVEQVLTAPEMPVGAMRSRSRSRAVERGKILALAAGTEPVALVVWVEQNPNTTLDIAIELWPINPDHRLPPEVQMILWEPHSEQLMAQAQGGGSERLQFRFSGKPGDRFDVKVMHKDFTALEPFVI
ncbi:MAG: DUF1822 family protein [Spirulina sp. SIO3F2]|nr:DUF1822 family protein [Spirulina sp. SIO3F2]